MTETTRKKLYLGIIAHDLKNGRRVICPKSKEYERKKKLPECEGTTAHIRIYPNIFKV